MQILSHIIASGIFSLVLYPFLGINVLIIFLASILMDLDHYPVYILTFKKFNLKESYHYFKTDQSSNKLFPAPTHTIEFILLIIALSFYLEIFLYILMGILFHTVTDIFHNIYYQEIRRPFSIIYWLIKHTKL